MSSGFSHKQLMLAERLSLLASIGFVITNPLARLSISLSKHCDLVPNCPMPAVVHSQQALDLDAQITIVRGRSSPKTPRYF